MPFAVASHDGVLTCTLDTPGSRVNIFNHATATQLVDIMSGVTPANTRAVVFETAKPSSFINGVGLLLAHASQSADDVVRASTPAWTAYRAVRDAPVPTIAVVRGSCFGCGVEFALQCDYRIAGESHETRFYMTELNDYLFIPVFGSTWNLPEAVGLQGAIDLLLWGERWGARQAWERGLVDATAPDDQIAAHGRRFVDEVLAGARPSRRRGPVSWGAAEDRMLAQARARVAALPPAYRRVYGDALDLLEAGARRVHGYVEHQRHEVERSADSVLSPIGKAAYAFFYLRQMASERAVGRGREEYPRVRFALEVPPADAARPFADDLRRRVVPGIELTDAAAAEFRLVSATDGHPRAPFAGHDVAVRIAPAPGPERPIELYAPGQGRLVELAAGADVSDGETTARLARSLQRLGFEVALTTPRDAFVSTRLLAAYLAPLVRAIGDGGDVPRLNGALRAAGFVRRPHDVLADMDRGAVAAAVAPLVGILPADMERLLGALTSDPCAERPDGELMMDALCVSLLDAVLGIRARREVCHTAIVDLIARELLDFPRHLCSLCAWLKRERVSRALERDLGALVTPAAIGTARAFVTGGRELYR